MSNPEGTRIDSNDEANEYSDGEYEWSDDDGQLLDIVLALPAMKLSEPRDEAGVASELLVAAVQEASTVSKGKAKEAGGSGGSEVSEWKKFLKPKGVNTDLVLSTGVSSGSEPEIVKTLKKKGSSQLTNLPQGPPCCNICGKGFASWKAVFGHLKTHKNRGYVGFLPPPTFKPAEEGFGGVVAASSGGGASQERDGVVVAASGGTGASGSGTGGPGVDLNVDLLEEEKAAAPGSGSAPRFDLNKSPPHDEDEEQEGNAAE